MEIDLLLFTFGYILLVLGLAVKETKVMKIQGKGYKYLAVGLMIVGVLALLTAVWFFPWGGDESSDGLSSKLDHFGSFVGAIIGGFFSLASVLLILQTLNEQDNDHRINQMENRFFQLLNMHNENVQTLSVGGLEGRKVFIQLIEELRLVQYCVANWDVEKKRRLDKSDIIGIGYEIFFFGYIENKFEPNILHKRLQKYNVKHGEIKDILSFVKREQEKLEGASEWFYKPFDGHQSTLGHYYRHLYQCINFIDSQSLLSYEEKYSYVKMLRAQMSNHEQILFFYNSYSFLGEKWERGRSIEPSTQLITKYNLVKNIPHIQVLRENLSNYYPTVRYEGHYKDSNERISWRKKAGIL